MTTMQANITRIGSGPKYLLRATINGPLPTQVDWISSDGGKLKSEDCLARDAILQALLRDLPDAALENEMHRRTGLSVLMEERGRMTDTDERWRIIRAAGNSLVIALSVGGVAALLAMAFAP